MGYCIDVKSRKFSFDKDKADKIVEAVKEAIITKKITEERWISFDNILKAEDVEELFKRLRFNAWLEEGKYKIEFTGEKLGGYEDDLFYCIAPYVNDGFLTYIGEDGDRWMYSFENGKCEVIWL